MSPSLRSLACRKSWAVDAPSQPGLDAVRHGHSRHIAFRLTTVMRSPSGRNGAGETLIVSPAPKVSNCGLAAYPVAAALRSELVRARRDVDRGRAGHVAVLDDVVRA